ncbi:hypothetical protein C900_04329 [Fulvivirga imtechensis AK7]|uniref:Periplasmic ATP/GTP-binding protein n=1 Tax=Fulvivirga imtechensis AK7 TaxID=1237149 RepID=L8K1Z0_9BACT|nr:SMP-30/gluconolactonase/LRE family protein [Fulvivirga imtechensis]ELR73477.1 hypothetical protein C900_04329 [Fulvivirga imtechensis AK7]
MKALFIALVLLIAHFGFAQKPVEKVYEIPEVDLIPEGIAYDPAGDAFYIGSIYKSKIIKIDNNGQISNFTGENEYGPWGYLGMSVKDGILWTCRSPLDQSADSTGFSGLFGYDLKSGKLSKKYVTAEGGHLFNDLVFNNNDIYITDTDGGAIYKVNTGKDSLEVFVPARSLIGPNGITVSPDGGTLIISTVRGLQKLDLKTREITPLSHPVYYIIGNDGLYTYKNTLIGFHNITKPESINQFVLNQNIDAIDSVNVLACCHEDFYLPTTGVIKGNWLYFLANTYVAALNDNKELEDKSTLKNPLVYRVRLD